MTTAVLNSGTAAYVGGLSGNAKAGGWSARTFDDAAIYNIAAGTGIGTIECFFKQPGAPAARQVIAGSASIFYIGVEPSGVISTSINGTFTAFSAVSDNAWHHVAIVFSGSNVSLFLDGTRVQSRTNTNPYATGNPTQLTIGGFQLNGGVTWVSDALIDEFAVSTVAKYTGATYTIPATPLPATATGQTALYRFNGDLADSNTSSPPTVSGSFSSTPTTGTAGTALGTAGTYTITNGPASGTRGYIFLYDLTTNTLASGITIQALTTATGNVPNYTPTIAGSYEYAIAPNADGSGTFAVSPAIAIAAAAGGAVKLPNDPGIVYSPATWNVTASAAEAVNGGSYFRTLFTGNSVTLTFNTASNSTPLPQIYVRVDGVGWQQFTLASSISVTMPTANAAWPHHALEVLIKATPYSVPRWSPRNASVVLTGITLATGGTLSAPSALTKTVWIYGDSITEGQNTISLASAGNECISDDALTSYAYQQRLLLGAEVAVIGFGGAGVAVGANSGSGVPALTATYNFLWSGQARSFTPAPDLIVINYGTNDGVQGVAAGTFQAAFQAVLQGLLGATPSRTLIAVLRPFGGYMASSIQAAIAAVGSPRVTYVDTTGFFATADSVDGIHPLGVANLGAIGPIIANAVRPMLDAATAPPAVANVLIW